MIDRGENGRMDEAAVKRKALRRQAMALPLQPGVYLMYDGKNQIIYIGKAKALKNRVSQYFGSDARHPEKVRRMVSHVDRFEYILTTSEYEALVLECSLIKQYSPKYNILLKDDKGYHYIRVSPPPFSRISEAKKIEDDGATYLGPYISGFSVKQAVEEAQRIFQLPTCNRPLAYGVRRERPCLNKYIGQCCAPCTGRIKEEEYNEMFKEVLTFLQQGSRPILESLTKQMEQAAEDLAFEKAAMLRDRIAAIRRIAQKQRVVMSEVEEQDVIAVAQGPAGVCFEVFRFTKGRLSDSEYFLETETESLPAARAEFLRRYYSLRDRVPPQIAVDGELEDTALLKKWLSEKAGRSVRLVFPQKGEAARLMDMCRNNAAERVARQTGVAGKDVAALDELSRLLSLPAPPKRIESYDISHTAGAQTVGGMVVFQNARPYKAAYRRFKIQSVVGADDYGALREMLTRRFEEYRKNPEGDDGFGTLPDLILIDGGRGQTAVAQEVAAAFDLPVPVFGLVKDSHHRTRAITGEGGEIAVSAKRAAFTLVSTIQEEVHRFAIAYHRSRRQKSGLQTVLTTIDGVGKTRAQALLRHFGSLRAIRAATVDELAAVKGIPRPVAETIRTFLDREETE